MVIGGLGGLGAVGLDIGTVRRTALLAQRSLESIIKEVIEEAGVYNEANVRKYRRYFYKLIEKMGGDIEVLKKGTRNISFDENEVGFIRSIIKTLCSFNKSTLSDFIEGNDEFTPVIVHKFLEELAADLGQSDISEDEKRRQIQFFSDIFLLSDKRIIEECHTIIDMIAQRALVFSRPQRLFMSAKIPSMSIDDV